MNSTKRLSTKRLCRKVALEFQECVEHYGYDYAIDYLRIECIKQPFLQKMVGQLCELYFHAYKFMDDWGPDCGICGELRALCIKHIINVLEND